jgi:hypothetical protein
MANISKMNYSKATEELEVTYDHVTESDFWNYLNELMNVKDETGTDWEEVFVYCLSEMANGPPYSPFLMMIKAIREQFPDKSLRFAKEAAAAFLAEHQIDPNKLMVRPEEMNAAMKDWL